MEWIEKLTTLAEIFPLIIYNAHEFQDRKERIIPYKIKKIANSAYFYWDIDGIKIYSDDPNNPSLDAIFPPHLESLFLTRLIPEAYGTNKFLDVGIGTGILSIYAAKKGWDVLGVDICDRSIRVSRLNSLINNVDVIIKRDSLAKSYNSHDIQICIANLPFEPTPDGLDNYLHSDGGLYGDRLIKEFLKNLDNILTANGIAIIPSFSLVSNGLSRLEQEMKSEEYQQYSRAVIALSDLIDIKLIYCRYISKKWKKSYSRLKSEGYENFRIEIGIFKKEIDIGKYLGMFEIKCADKEWIMPLGLYSIGIPKNNPEY